MQQVDGGDALAVDARVVGDQSGAETLHQVDRVREQNLDAGAGFAGHLRGVPPESLHDRIAPAPHDQIGAEKDRAHDDQASADPRLSDASRNHYLAPVLDCSSPMGGQRAVNFVRGEEVVNRCLR